MIKIVEKAADKQLRKQNEKITPRHLVNNSKASEEVVCITGLICVVLDKSGELHRRYMF